MAFMGVMHRHGQDDAAVCLALSWAGYLRASEALALNALDVALPGDPRLGDVIGEVAGILIRESKTGLQQFVVIRDVAVRHLLLHHITSNRLGPHANLFKLSYKSYLRIIKSTATFLDIQAWNFATHSARIGGALFDYLQGTYIDTIDITGRWASSSSVQRYLTNGRVQLMSLSFTKKQQQQHGLDQAVDVTENWLQSTSPSRK